VFTLNFSYMITNTQTARKQNAFDYVLGPRFVISVDILAR